MTVTKAKMGLIFLFALGIANGGGEAAGAPTDLYGDPLPPGAIARLGTVRFRHRGWRMCDMVVSPNGDTLISAGDRSIEMWDVHSGRRRRQIDFSQPNPYYVAGIDLSPDGKLLAVNRNEGKPMRFWNLDSGAEVHPFGDAAPVAGRAVFSPNGDLLATLDAGGGNPGTVSIWDIRKGKHIRTIEGGEPISSAVRCLAFSPDGKMLAFPHGRGIRVWDLAAGKELHQLDPGVKAPMGYVAFSFDSKLLAAAGNPHRMRGKNSIYLWDMTTGKEVGPLKGHEQGITALVASPKSNLLASASLDGTIRYWDLAKRQEIGRSPAPSRIFGELRFSADGSILASGEENGALRLWDARSHTEIAATAKDSVQWVRFAPDGQTLISTAEGQIGLWEPLTGRPRHIFNVKDLFDFEPSLSPDGKILAAASYWIQGQASLWDVATGKLVRRLGESGKPGFSTIMFLPDGRRVAGKSDGKDILRVWDAANGKELLQWKTAKDSSSFAFAPDGASLVSTGGDLGQGYTIRMCKLATGEEIWRKATRPLTSFGMQFSPDGRTLVLIGGPIGTDNARGEAYLWEAATGKELKRFDGHRERVGCAAFCPDGRMLATGSRDHTVRLWEIATGGERQCLHGHQNRIMAVSFSPDGRLLASASGDSTALVWDLTGRFHEGRFQPRRLSAQELDRCWDDLAHADAARAYRSILALTGSPKEAIALLKDRLPPVTAAEPKRVAPLIVALDSAQFTERDKAMTELEKIGLGVEPVLHAALDHKPSLEVRRRIEAVLEKLAGGPRWRFLRALEVLEHVATVEARQLLESLSQGTAELWPTHEAKASLKWLAVPTNTKN